MIRARDLRRLTLGLRFRLTATYALFFSVLLIAVTGAFHVRLASTLNTEAHDALEQRWAAMKGYMRIEMNDDAGKIEAIWYYDDKDPDESRIVLGARSVFLCTDQDGNIVPDLEDQPSVSQTYRDIGVDSVKSIRADLRQAVATGKPLWTTRRNKQGTDYLIRSGVVWDEHYRVTGTGSPYFVAIGYSLANNEKTLREFSLLYIAVIPGSLILGSLLGWVMAGRSLTPVRAAAQAAQRISSSNLSLRIPVRGAGDELDYLILTFNRMIDRLEASFQQMKQFSTDVSHELRTPITAIRGQIEVALFTAQTTDQYREAMFNALQDIDRLSQIVRALFLLSQAESGQVVLQKSHLDLAEVVRDQVEQFQIPAEAAAVRLTADLPDHCPVEVDRVQIERLISNLLSNALKFTPEGGSVRVALRASAHGSDIELVVEDTGCGIPTEHLPHIFDRFYRVPSAGAAPSPEQGLGLGLSFVAWIAKVHGGTIDVESAPGKGTRFTVKLPAASAGSVTLELSRKAAEPIMKEL
ncbi:MAG TPA: heavy metal sensor histidine kinase [Bryobacteraceae bacterium]|nr:heavy metal sensor histidine kinase [Bryobacteraceae bacterium]